MYLKRLFPGFTLIELLIVVVIIGTLAVAFLPSAINAPKKARDAQRQSALNLIIQAVEQYALDNGNYPLSGSYGCLNPNESDATKIGALLKPYFKSGVPIDPDPNAMIGTTCIQGQYLYLNGTTCYMLYSRMEIDANANYKSTTLPLNYANDCSDVLPKIDATGTLYSILKQNI